MAAVESTPSSGPQYAPDDPSLPKPWKALINGSVLYYWNPETNVTQYEKPVVPLPHGPPLATAPATPKLSSVTQQDHSGDLIGQQDLQIMQNVQGQHLNQIYQQHEHVMPQRQHFQQQGQPHHVLQQHPSLSQQVLQHSGQPQQVLQHSGQPQQVSQHSGMKMPQQFSQHLPHQVGQQTAFQPGKEIPMHAVQPVVQQMGQQTPQQQVSQMPQTQGHQYTQQHPQFFAHQQSMQPQRPHGMQQQSQQQTAQAQPYPQPQDLNATFSKWEEVELHTSTASGMNSIPLTHMGAHPGQLQQFSATSINSQIPASAPMHQRGNQLNSPGFSNIISSASQNPQSNAHISGALKNGYEDNLPERVGKDFYFNPNKEGSIIPPHHPKLAAIPVGRNQQVFSDLKMGGPSQNATPIHVSGGLIAVAGQNMPNHFNPRTDGPSFSNNSLIRQPPTAFGSSVVAGSSPSEVYCRQHEISTMGENVPPPFMTFEATGFPPEILREIHLAGFPSPTPIQAQTWPIALQARDIVAIAKTGSGKTLGYLIPAFIHLRRCRNNPLLGPSVLVLAPTRELATQIQDEVIKFGRSSRVSCTCLYGGAPKGPQLKELERGADIVVATPGRLNDILEMKKIEFGQISFLVLDEADRMLDMGFEPQIHKIVKEIPPHRQTLMYTATWPKEVRKIAGDLLANPVQVNIGSVNELAANKAITQYVEVVPQMEKQRRVEQIVRSQERGAKIIIFCSTKRLCDQLTRSVGRNFGAAAIHGDKSQGERDYVLNQFRSGKTPILVATDVAARGLDIKDIRVVINYDFPTGVDDYVHRIGRTGRAGATGVSYTFFSDQDWKHAADLIKVLEGANQVVPPAVREMAVRGGPSFNRDRDGMMNRFEGGRGDMRDGGFSGGRGGMRDAVFRGGFRDGGFSGGRGGRDSGRGGGGMRDGGFGGRGGMRDGAFGGFRGNGYGGGGRGGNRVMGRGGFGRNDRGPRDRFEMGGRDRFDSRRDRNRGKSYSSSPEKVRTWGYSRSRSRSDSRSRSRSRTYRRSVSRSRSRSWSRSRSRSRSWSRSPSRGRASHGRSFDVPEKLNDEKASTVEPLSKAALPENSTVELSPPSVPES